jgi:hypothetical protein
MTHDSDELEPTAGSQLPALANAHTISQHEQHHGHDHDHDHDHDHEHGTAGQGGQNGGFDPYELHAEHLPLLPGKILTDTIARLRFTIMMVGYFYTVLIYIVSILAVCLLAPHVFMMLDNASPIYLYVARVIISLISIGLALGCIFFVFKQRELTDKLALAEVMIDNIRDFALIQMQATRYNLADLSERLKFPQEQGHPSAFDYIALAKKIGPVISLLLARERSVVTIAVEGVKLFQLLRKVLHK